MAESRALDGFGRVWTGLDGSAELVFRAHTGRYGVLSTTNLYGKMEDREKTEGKDKTGESQREEEENGSSQKNGRI